MNKFLFTTAGLCVLTLAGCGNGDDDLLGQNNGASDIMSLEISPVTATIPMGLDQQYLASVTLRDGSVVDVTNDASLLWASSNSSIAMMDSNTHGLAHGETQGNAIITATLTASNGSFSDTGTLTVSAATLVDGTGEIVVDGNGEDGQTFPAGTTVQLEAEVTYTDGTVASTENGTNDSDYMTWSVEGEGATITPEGALDLTNVEPGTTITVTATGNPGTEYEDQTDTITITVGEGDDPVVPIEDNLAPEFQNTGIWTYNASNPSLRMYGDYFDAEGDLAGVHELSWYRDGVKIEGETLDYLTLSADDYNTDGSLKAMRGCGIPVARTGTLRGEEVCVDYDASNFVVPPEGDEPPTAKITVSGTQALNNVVSSVYTYTSPTSTPEGNSRHVWFAYKLPSGNMPSLVTDDADETICADASAGKQCDLAITEEIEYAYLYSCVTPEDENGLVGYGDCSDSLTNSGTNVVPSMSNVAISGTPYPGEVLRVSGDYLDLDDDKPGLHLYSWRVDGTPVDGQTQSTLTLDDSMLGSHVTACVTPIALTGRNPGEQVCSEEPGVLVEDPASAPPTAVAEIVTLAPLAGETISAQYSYAQVDNVAEQGSTFTWYREDASGQRTLLKTCDAAMAGTACDYESQTLDVGTRIMACVLPKSSEGIVGSESCAYAGVDDGNGNIIVPGIKVTGVLEYNETLTVEKVGDVEGPITWKMNLAAPFDGTNDDPATRTEIPTEQGGVGDSETYYIGTMQYIRDNNLIPDSNANGVIDDADWEASPPTDVLDARFFIGKDVSVCVADEKYGDICRDASNFQSATADSCESSSECVTSGLFLDIDDASERGVMSQSLIVTPAGEKMFSDPSLADLKYKYNLNENQLESYLTRDIRVAYGVSYPLFSYNTTNDIEAMYNHCQLVTNKSGGVPAADIEHIKEGASPVKSLNELSSFGNPEKLPTAYDLSEVVRGIRVDDTSEVVTVSVTTGLIFGRNALSASSATEGGLFTFRFYGQIYADYSLETPSLLNTSKTVYCTSY